jgi:hypothetical protein
VADRSRDETVRVVVRRGGQALLYQRVLNLFQVRRSRWTGVSFYDLYEVPSGRDCGSAITRPDWSNRPAFRLYQAFIKANP